MQIRMGLHYSFCVTFGRHVRGIHDILSIKKDVHVGT
jgi:hypothetical protein